MNSAVQTKLGEGSRDSVVSELLETVNSYLNREGSAGYYIGSVALMAHLPDPHRIPTDVDIVVPTSYSKRFLEHFSEVGFSVSQVPGFIEATKGKKKVHCVVEGLHMLSVDRSKTLDIVDLQLVSHQLVHRSIDFPFGGSFSVLVPLPEIALSTLLLQPVDCGVVYDTALLASSVDLDSQNFFDFLIGKPTALQLVRIRLAQIIEVVESRTGEAQGRLDYQAALAGLVRISKFIESDV